MSPQAPANLPEGRMVPGVALRVQLSYLMLGRACSESLGLGRWGGSPESMGRAPLSSPLKRTAAHKWCFRNILHMVKFKPGPQQPKLGFRINFFSDAIGKHRCVCGGGHGAQDGPTGGRTSVHTDPSQQLKSLRIF